MPKYNLGHKMESPAVAGPSEDKNKIYYPSINISTEDVEGLELKIGQKVKLVGLVTGKDEHKRDDKKKEIRYNIDIEQLNKGYSEDEYMGMSDEEKDDADAKDLEEKRKAKND